MLVFALSGKLRQVERNILENSRWSVSSIVWWELAKLIDIGRINPKFEETYLKRKLKNIQVWPIDIEVAFVSTRLDFKGDPADEIIAATSIVNQVPLMTRDRSILQSKVVPFANSVV